MVVGQVRSYSQCTHNQSLESHSRGPANEYSDSISDKLTRKPGPMTRKRKRRSSVVEIGNGPARVKIYTMNRRDGYPEFTLAWKEAGRRRTRSFASMEEECYAPR